MKNNKHALEFIKNEHAMQYMGLDDEMPDDFGEWMSELDEIAWVTIMSRFRESIIDKIDTLKIEGVPNAHVVQKAIIIHLNK